MYNIQKATYSDLQDIIPLFLDLNPQINQEQWMNLFAKHWEAEDDYIGHIVKHEDKIVGFAGLIFSIRTIDGKKFKICNRTSSVISKDYQGQGIGKKLIQKSAELTNHTVTTFSSKDVTIHILKKLGFKLLDSHVRFILPFPSLAKKNVKIHFNKLYIEKSLNGKDLKYFEDHRDLNGHQLLLESNDKKQKCLIILTKTIKKGIKLGWIHYISNPEFFNNNIHRHAYRICKNTNSHALMIDKRYLKEQKPKYSILYKLPQPRLYKSDQLSPQQIDSLYSEFFLF